ncbi:hypothetical protein [Luteimicrobium subarcticum]|uniref:Uncharacterized protein n=1 Tax=Luteimicrobium subarcticum TaxID=620910 RepID=A0A2M8WRI5_9MICO|nr:hypothetical protein [Luteimicrobium subarcticum]PJI93543.1 hypothetical protein CLV34_2117 [Luteimicrobium subarcticum]
MVAITTIDGEALLALCGWPEDTSTTLPSALWLPAELDDEPEMFSELCASWRDEAWYGLATWRLRAATAAAGRGFAARYEGLCRESIGDSHLITPRGVSQHSEWCALDPGASSLYDFFAATRLSRGLGSALAIAPSDGSPGNWFAASAATLQRSMLRQMSPEIDITAMDRFAALSYLAATSPLGYAALVPLNLHPWGGCVVIGGDAQRERLRSLLPDSVPGLADVSAQEVVAYAGGLSL